MKGVLIWWKGKLPGCKFKDPFWVNCHFALGPHTISSKINFLSMLHFDTNMTLLHSQQSQ